MLEAIRRYDVLDKDLFYQYGNPKGNALRSFAEGGIVLYFMLMVILGGGLSPWLFLFSPVFFILPAVGMLHPLYRAPKSARWRENYDLRYEGNYYRCLPAEDKALYPYNIIKTITDPDLTSEQAKALDTEMENLRNSIEDRNRQRRLAVKKHLDISDYLTSMKEAQASVQIETDTYKELM